MRFAKTATIFIVILIVSAVVYLGCGPSQNPKATTTPNPNASQKSPDNGKSVSRDPTKDDQNATYQKGASDGAFEQNPEILAGAYLTCNSDSEKFKAVANEKLESNDNFRVCDVLDKDGKPLNAVHSLPQTWHVLCDNNPLNIYAPPLLPGSPPATIAFLITDKVNCTPHVELIVPATDAPDQVNIVSENSESSSPTPVPSNTPVQDDGLFVFTARINASRSSNSFVPAININKLMTNAMHYQYVMTPQSEKYTDSTAASRVVHVDLPSLDLSFINHNNENCVLRISATDILSQNVKTERTASCKN